MTHRTHRLKQRFGEKMFEIILPEKGAATKRHKAVALFFMQQPGVTLMHKGRPANLEYLETWDFQNDCGNDYWLIDGTPADEENF